MTARECPACLGSGLLTVPGPLGPQREEFGQYVEQTCNRCGGSGAAS